MILGKNMWYFEKIISLMSEEDKNRLTHGMKQIVDFSRIPLEEILKVQESVFQTSASQ